MPTPRVLTCTASLAAVLGLGCLQLPGTLSTRTSPVLDAPAISSVAVMPIAHWSLDVGEARELAADAALALRRGQHGLQVVEPDVAAEGLNVSGLLRDWALWLSSYVAGESEPDTAVVINVGALLGVDAIVIFDLTALPAPSVEELTDSGYFRVQASLLDCRAGTVVWVAWFDPDRQAFPWASFGPRVAELVHGALNTLLRALPALGRGANE